MTITDTGKTTWTEAAEEVSGDVDFEVYPDYVVAMAMLEQQKRAADALEQIAGHKRLKEQDRVLREIRYLARTDNPDVEYTGRWDEHRLNEIANMASRAIRGE